MKLTYGEASIIHLITCVISWGGALYSIISGGFVLCVSLCILSSMSFFLFVITFQKWLVIIVKKISEEVVKSELSDPQ